MDLEIDPRRHGIVKRLVIDVVLVIATRVRVTWPAHEPVILVLVLINTDYGGVIWFTSPLLSLKVSEASV